MRILLFCFAFLSVDVLAQADDLDHYLLLINSKYSTTSYMAYDVVSTHQSLLSDTVNFSYATRNVIRSAENSLGIRDFYTTNKENLPLFGFFSNHLYKFDTKTHKIHAWPIEQAIAKLKRGEFRWAAFSPFIYFNLIIDTIKWNNHLPKHSMHISGDTVLITMERFFANEDKFHADDPDTASSKIVLKASLKDSLIYAYQEILNISKKPLITTYVFSNYSFVYNQVKFLSLKQSFEEVLATDSVIDYTRNTSWLALRKPIADNFNDTFKIYDLQGDSIRIADLQHRYLMIDFWFCGCPPCEKAAKVLNNIQEKYGPEKIKIIGINFIDKLPAKIEQCAVNSNFEQFFLKNRDEIKFLDYYGAPTILIYSSKDKRVVDTFEGYTDDLEASLEEVISLLN